MKVLRVEHDGRARYAVESDGAWRLIDGDPSGQLEALEQLKQGAESAARSGAKISPAHGRSSTSAASSVSSPR